MSLTFVYQNENTLLKTVLDSTYIFQKYILDFLVNSQIYVTANINGTITLFELYQICGKGNILIRQLNHLFGNISNKSNQNFIWERRSNLENCPFRIGYFDYETTVLNNSTNDITLSSSKHGNKRRIVLDGITLIGPSSQFFRILQDRLNFSATWIYVKDEKFGLFDKTLNDWNGIV